MRKLYHVLLVCLVWSVYGCGDFLDPKSSDEYVPENAQALDEMLVNEAYMPLKAGSIGLFMYHTIFSDDVAISPLTLYFDDYNQAKADGYFALFTMQPDFFLKLEEASISTYLIWDDFYSLILGANAALDYVDGVNDLQENKDYVKAQALSLRAFYYFQLVNLFAWPYNYDKDAPGVPLKLTSALSLDFTERHSVGTVYGQIVDDLEEAADLFRGLPEKRQFSKNYRINLPAVYLLLSRVNLYMENWSEAIRYADSVMVNPNFELYDLLSFESTTAQPKAHYAAYSNSEIIWNYGGNDDIVRLLNDKTKVVDAGTKQYSIFNASSELLDLYEEEDARKENYILDEVLSGSKTGCLLPMGKMITNSNQVSSSEDYLYSFRLSEVYLILAEAYAMQGKSAEALRYLNDLREKRIENYQEVSGLSGDDLIQFVRDERRRELCFEGQRWFDMRRWGMESFTRKWKMNDDVYHNYVIEKNDPAFVFPIPDDVLERNPGLEQNQLANVRQESK